MNIGDNIKVIERTQKDGVFEWDGQVVDMNDTYVVTTHCRNPVTHGQWHSYTRAYEKIWTKHYYHPDGKLNGIGVSEI